MLGQALRLEYLTVGWNVIEGLVAIAAAVAAGGAALLGFGIDSFVESASGSIIIWRLLASARGPTPKRSRRSSVAAIAMCVFLVREGRDAWEGEVCSDV